MPTLLRVTLAMMLALTGALAKAQSDVVVIDNGDRLTGEIKALDRGLLSFKTDATNTIQIEWMHVLKIDSDQNFLVTLDDGRRLFGSWSASDAEAMLRLDMEEGSLDLPLLLIVRMTPIEGRLIDRISMSIDIGHTFAKANDVRQTDIGYDFRYRSEERLISANFDAARSSTSDEPSSTRSNTTFSYRRFVGERKWDPVGFGAVERNDELGLDRRVTLGGGMSRWLTDTNANRISFTGGMVTTRESEAAATKSEGSVEAVAAVELDWFRYADPELDVAMRFAAFERLTDTRRTRGNLDLDLRWELVSDFFWGFSLYYSFNSEPIGVDVSSSDYGVVTSVGWSF